MKYIRGYLVAAIIGAVTWAFMALGDRFTTLVDMVYPYVMRTMQGMLAEWSHGVDFLVWQAIAMGLLAILLGTVVLMVVLKWNPIQWFGWVLTAASSIFLIYTLMFGLNYYAGPVEEDIRLEVSSYNVEELSEAATYYRDKANELATQINRDSQGNAQYQDFDTLANQAGEGFRTLTYDYSFSIYAGSTLPVKQLGWADSYSEMGVTGVFMGMTGEAAVNPQIPDVALPYSMCHEMAHRMCIAGERDSNFSAFLACSVNSSPEFQYSAYFMAYLHSYNTLASIQNQAASVAAARIASGVNENFAHDMAAYNRFFDDRYDETASNLADFANNTYLKISGDSGTDSYASVGDLLVYLYVQEIVLPAEEEDKKSSFDPYDETQVDLEGIVGALPKEGR